MSTVTSVLGTKQHGRKFRLGEVVFKQQIAQQVAGIKNGQVVPLPNGKQQLMQRDRIFYKGKYVGWVSYRRLSRIIFDVVVARVIEKEIINACQARDRELFGPVVGPRPVFYTSTSGKY